MVARGLAEGAPVAAGAAVASTAASCAKALGTAITKSAAKNRILNLFMLPPESFP
jgi:hypothetical protein